MVRAWFILPSPLYIPIRFSAPNPLEPLPCRQMHDTVLCPPGVCRCASLCGHTLRFLCTCLTPPALSLTSLPPKVQLGAVLWMCLASPIPPLTLASSHGMDISYVSNGLSAQEGQGLLYVVMEVSPALMDSQDMEPGWYSIKNTAKCMNIESLPPLSPCGRQLWGKRGTNN